MEPRQACPHTLTPASWTQPQQAAQGLLTPVIPTPRPQRDQLQDAALHNNNDTCLGRRATHKNVSQIVSGIFLQEATLSGGLTGRVSSRVVRGSRLPPPLPCCCPSRRFAGLLLLGRTPSATSSWFLEAVGGVRLSCFWFLATVSNATLSVFPLEPVFVLPCGDLLDPGTSS